MNAVRPTRSLKSKALQLLAQREQSRVELRRKLLAHARKLAEAEPDAAAGPNEHAQVEAEGEPALSLHVDEPPASAAARERAASPKRARSLLPAGGGVAAVGRGDRPCVAGSASALTGEGDRKARVSAGEVDDVLTWLDAHGFASDDRFAESRINARSSRYGDLRIRQELKQHGVALDAAAVRALGETEASRGWAVWRRRFGSPPATAVEAAKHARFLTARGFSPDTVRKVLRQARAVVGDNLTLSEDD